MISSPAPWRRAGGAATIAGVLLLILLAGLIDLEMEGVGDGATLPFLVWLVPLCGMALSLGITAVYLDTAAPGGVVAGINFLLVFAGTFTSTLVLFFGFASAAGGGPNPTLIGSHAPGPLPPPFLGNFFLLSGLLFVIGWPLFGWSCLRHGRYPRWACWLLIVGVPLGFPLRLPLPGGRAFGVLIWGVGLGTIGWQLWRKRPSFDAAV